MQSYRFSTFFDEHRKGVGKPRYINSELGSDVAKSRSVWTSALAFSCLFLVWCHGALPTSIMNINGSWQLRSDTRNCGYFPLCSLHLGHVPASVMRVLQDFREFLREKLPRFSSRRVLDSQSFLTYWPLLFLGREDCPIELNQVWISIAVLLATKSSS